MNIQESPSVDDVKAYKVFLEFKSCIKSAHALQYLQCVQSAQFQPRKFCRRKGSSPVQIFFVKIRKTKKRL